MYAAICLNGHLCEHIETPHSTSRLKDVMVLLSADDWFPRFCGGCGAEVLAACPSCREPLRSPDLRFCEGCGKMLPWTESALSAATELTKSLEELTGKQKDDFCEIIPQLAFITPRAELLFHKAAPIVEKLKPGSKELLVKVLVSILSDTALRGLNLK